MTPGELHERALGDTRLVSQEWADNAVATWHRRTAEGHPPEDALRYVLTGLLGELVAEITMPVDMTSVSWRDAFRATVDHQWRRCVKHLRKIGTDYYSEIRDFTERHPRLQAGTSVSAVMLAAADEIERLRTADDHDERTH